MSWKEQNTFNEIITDEINLMRNAVKSGKSLFVCGRAGTGKSQQLKWIKQWSKGENLSLVCLAPTGVAATNIGGQTIHSFFGLPIGIVTENDAFRSSQRMSFVKKSICRSLDILVIDEASMVRADVLSVIDEILKILRGDDSPFGGIQVVMFGDPYQLSPIVRKEEESYINDKFKNSFFFSASCIKHMYIIEFTEIFRQREKIFTDALNSLRIGVIPSNHKEIFNIEKTSGTNFSDAITLTSLRNTADGINNFQLKALAKKNREKIMMFYAKFDGLVKPSDFLAPEVLTVCVGARVMILINSTDGDYNNGTIAKIVSIDTTPNATSTVEVELPNGSNIVLRPHHWEKYEYTYVKGEVHKKVVGKMTQLPIQLAWASTIHKAQGLTLDRVHVNLEGGAFSSGQVYVALSRCTTLKGLTLERHLTRKDVFCDEKADDFRRKMRML